MEHSGTKVARRLNGTGHIGASGSELGSRRAIVFGVLLLVGGHAIAQESGTQTRDAPASTADRDHDVWKRVVRQGAFETYERLRRSLVDKTITRESLIGFGAIIDEPNRLDWIEFLACKLDGPDRAKAVQKLYAELMLARPSADVLYGCLKQRIDQTMKRADERPRRRGMIYAWPLSDATFVCTEAYEATGQERFLTLLADTFEQMLPHRDSAQDRVDQLRKRVMHGWGGHTYHQGYYTTNITAAGRITYPVARFCQIVLNDPGLEQRYGDQARRFIEVVEQVIGDYDGEFHVAKDTGRGYYRGYRKAPRREGEPRPPPRYGHEPLNHMLSAGNTLIILHDITEQESYLNRAWALALFFRAAMREEENGCLVWYYTATPRRMHGGPPEYIWKARVSMHFAQLAEQHGIVFTAVDLEKICRTFMINVYRESGPYNATIYRELRSLDTFEGRTHGRYANVLPFMKLDEYCPEIRAVLEELVSTRPEVGGWFARTHGGIAYVHRLRPLSEQTLGGGASAPP